MLLLQRLARQFRSARTWIGLGILAPLGMLVISGLMLLDLRRDAWDKAEQTSRNLLQVIERDIARNVEIFDLSIQAVVDNLHAPGLDAVDPAMRQLVLFDRAATARDLGVMLVIDERGDIVVDAGAVPPRKGSYADREYFQVHKGRADLGLYVGRPIVSRLTGEPMLPFSRRIAKPDGSFGGVVLGSLKLSYFSRLFDQIGLGPEGGINLYLRDGTRIMRYPHEAADIGVSIAGSSNFERFVSARNGAFIGTSVRDGVERHYAFTQVGDLPLVLNVALSTRDVEAEWRAKALGIGATVLILCGLTIGLALLFGRELSRRAAVEIKLAHLSRTDTLTGLPNRRQFDEVFAQAWKSARRTGKPLSLLIVDADHFKRYNDRYGHAVGDAVLKGLANGLAGSVHRPNDLVSRIGGEEFALLLPDTDEAGALRIAEAVHAQVAALTVGSAGIGAGAVTVSIGLALPGDRDAEASDLYRRADEALYVAKARGRNRTERAPSTGNERIGMLRVI
ncbi:sensor domain-containing diguanylate cyclase [Methylobacterium sp. J-078]|uniref:sensor domain-containing diguanylate cyclase n=1 Tax=Methylobacterium sp. J-078 TaxID=2836657 RepID=UPI001FBA42E9|nr:sensor domain-containing diguanylate cyclase [Methylobacterium sp. J-078]MCJ2047313.1 sensor domain-containing diguanylate cyclase [Methylobacterium sp. J-078]